MPNAPISAPAGGLLAWVLASPQELARGINQVTLLESLQMQVVAVGNAAMRKQSLLWSQTNVLLPLPIQLATPYGAPTGTLSRLTFNADETTVIGNPPTQAQVQAVEARIEATRKIMAAFITDLQTAQLASAA